MTDWKPYSNNDEEWCFNLRGYIWRSPPPRRTLTTGRPPRPGQATVNEATKQDGEPNQPCATARPISSRGERMVQRTTTHGTQRATHPGETHVEATQAEITGIHSVQRWQGYLVLKHRRRLITGAGSMKGRAAREAGTTWRCGWGSPPNPCWGGWQRRGSGPVTSTTRPRPAPPGARGPGPLQDTRCGCDRCGYDMEGSDGAVWPEPPGAE